MHACLPECGFHDVRCECANPRKRENLKKVGLIYCFSITLEPFVALLGQVVLQNREANNIQTLIDVCGVRWIADHHNLVSACMLQKADSVVTAVPINNQKPVSTGCLRLGCLIEDLDPVDANLPVGPAFLLVPQTVKRNNK